MAIQLVFKQLRRFPAVRAKIDAELQKTLSEMEESIMSRERGVAFTENTELPAHGYTNEQIMDSLRG